MIYIQPREEEQEVKETAGGRDGDIYEEAKTMRWRGGNCSNV